MWCVFRYFIFPEAELRNFAKATTLTILPEIIGPQTLSNNCASCFTLLRERRCPKLNLMDLENEDLSFAIKLFNSTPLSFRIWVQLPNNVPNVDVKRIVGDWGSISCSKSTALKLLCNSVAVEGCVRRLRSSLKKAIRFVSVSVSYRSIFWQFMSVSSVQSPYVSVRVVQQKSKKLWRIRSQIEWTLKRELID